MSELREISIENCEKIGQGLAGAVYALDDKTIVKVAYGAEPEAIQKRMSHELTVAQELVRCGIPTPQAYEMVSVDGSAGLIYERLVGEDLSDYIKDHPDEIDALAAKVSEILHKLHRAAPQMGGFPSMKETLLAFLPKMTALYSDDELDIIRQGFEAVPDRDTFVHGDTNPGNFMRLSDGSLRIIDMGSVSIGHPYFEFYNMVPSYLLLDCITYGKEELYAYFARLMGETDAEGVQKNINLMKTYYDRLFYSYFAKLSDADRDTVIGNIWAMAFQKIAPLYGKLPLADEAEKQKTLQSLKEKYFTESKDIPPVSEWWKETE
ncbi:MAG: phosphotransferase [Lachnospiraceae bacterium]|nr:phosphotransferase [Lachnospiraceae bacterium]